MVAGRCPDHSLFSSYEIPGNIDSAFLISKSYAFGFGFDFKLPNSTRPANLIPFGLGAIANFK